MRRALIVAAAFAACSFASCSSDKTTNAEPVCPGRTSPENLLKALSCAYETRDVNEYADLLHADFIFVFIPDIAESLSLPPERPWWGKTEDIASTRNLFEDSAV